MRASAIVITAPQQDGIMPESTSEELLLIWLIEQFSGQELAPSRRSLYELSEVAARLVCFHLARRQPLRPAAVAKRIAILSRNLRRAAKAAEELGEQGMCHVLLESNANNSMETDKPAQMIADLQDWARWSTRASTTAKLMSESALDYKGGRRRDARLLGLVTMLMDRYEFLLSIKATQHLDPETGLGESTFDRFVKEALRHCAPEGVHFEGRRIDDAIRWALRPRKQSS